MRIIPVLDLMEGQVVRGVGGRRDAYRPIESPLVASAAPADVASAFVGRLALSEAYVADLDAIAGQPPSWDVYRRLIDRGLRLWVDAGISDTSRAAELASFRHGQESLVGIIAGLESLPDVQTLSQFREIAGEERFLFSLDMKNGKPITSVPAWRDATAEHIAQEALGLGVRRLIVLDLAQVGMSEGVRTGALCRHIRRLDASLEITAGGGVRGLDDLHSLADAGCNAALVASALHDARISPEEIQTLVGG